MPFAARWCSYTFRLTGPCKPKKERKSLLALFQDYKLSSRSGIECSLFTIQFPMDKNQSNPRLTLKKGCEYHFVLTVNGWDVCCVKTQSKQCVCSCMSHLTQSLIEIISTYQANTGWSQWVFQPWDVLADRMFQSNWSLLKHKEEHKDKNTEV